MAYVTHGRGSGFNHGRFIFFRLVSTVSLTFERATQIMRLRKTAKILKSLSPEQLADVGLTRSDVTSMADLGRDQAIWRLHAARKRAAQL